MARKFLRPQPIPIKKEPIRILGSTDTQGGFVTTVEAGAIPRGIKNYPLKRIPDNDFGYILIPKGDFIYNIIPSNDVMYRIIPSDLIASVIPSNDLTYLTIPDNDFGYTLTSIPNNDLVYIIIPNNDLIGVTIPINDIEYTLLPNSDLIYAVIPDDDLTGIIIPEDITYKIIPSNDIVQNLIPSNDIMYNVLPNNDGTYTIIPDNDGNFSLIPDNDGGYTLIPNNDLAYSILLSPPSGTSFSVSGGGTQHVFNAQAGIDWNGYEGNYLSVGFSQEGESIPPQAGWYFVDSNGNIRQLLNDTLWFSGGAPSPYPNGAGWLCVSDGSFTINNTVTSIIFYEQQPTVVFNI